MASGTFTSSAVWNFFLKESSDNAQCLLCNQIYSRKGRGTTNLKNHLKSKHKEQYAEMLEEEKKSEEKKDAVKTPLQKVQSDFRQKTVEECFTSVELWDASHTKSKEVDRFISEMVVMDGLPFSHVEDMGFMRFMSKTVPQYRLKQRNFYSTMICTDIYDAVCGQVKTMLSDITDTMGNSVSFTTDVWSDSWAGVSLLSLTAHAINRDFQRVKFVLEVQPLEERHTGDYISRKFNEMLDKWEISHSSVHCVVRDSGTNMKKALFLSGLNNLDCAVHEIQLVVRQGFQSQKPVCDIIEKCRRLATHFHHSTMAQDELKKIQEQLQLPHLKVLHDSPTQWNSTLHMLKRTEEIKEPLCVYVAKNPSMPQFSNVEWVTLSQCIKALEPFEELTQKMSESASTVADVIPLILCLKNALQPTTVESAPLDLDSDDENQDDYQKGVEIIDYMKETMKADIAKRFAGLEIDNNYRVATYLDPRYKGKFFSSLHVTKQVQGTVARLCDEFASVSVGGDDEPRKKRKRSDEPNAGSSKGAGSSIKSAMALIIASSSDEEPEERTKTNTMDMVHKYHKEKRLGADEDPLKWWKAKITEYPELGKLAKQYLSCPTSSVTSEQLFSDAGNIYDEKTNHLQGEKAEKLLFLKKNLPLLKFEY